MKIIVTGGAGFIGSCIIRYLNDREIDDIILVDNIWDDEKWKNLRTKRFETYINKSMLLERLNELKDVDVLIHMGACSSTTQTDFDYLWNNNVEYTKQLWKYCCEKGIRFLYASSASVYGDGKKGFSDYSTLEYIPLNRYGYSKYAFDVWSEKQVASKIAPPQYAGFRFFNVYGPNEYHKGSMSSLVYKGHRQIKENKEMKLFKSYEAAYEDGKQLRDFVYVKDICKVIGFFLDHPELNGIYNVGTGKARSFYDLAASLFSALGMEERIDYIDMPGEIRKSYQYFTQADIQKLRDVGYREEFYSLEDGISDYVNNYLENDYSIF